MSLRGPNNVFQESWLLSFVLGLFGLRVIGGRRRRWMSYLYSIFLAVLYTVSFLRIRNTMSRHYESFREVIFFFEDQKLQSYFGLFFFPALVFTSVSKSSENIHAYKKLDDVDQALAYLNTPINHEFEMKKEVVTLFTYVFTIILLDLATYYSLLTADCGHVFNFSMILNFSPIFIEIITLCAFDIFVEKVRVRFEQINRVIGDLLGPKKISVILVQSTDVNDASKLRLARRVHLQLHDAADAANKTYGPRLFLIFLATLISVLNYSRKALSLTHDYLAIFDLGLYLIWTCFHLGKYFHLISTCHSANRESKLAGGLFLEARLTRGSDGLNEEARALSRQLINRQLQFTVYNVFSIDFPKGLTVLVALFAYFLLLA